MKKGLLLNSMISKVISELGHTDQITIGDAGLPIPNTCERIDLAITKGLPSFMDVFKTTTQEMFVEHMLLASEIKTHNPAIHTQLLSEIKRLEEEQGNQIILEYQTHALFKERSKQSKAVIRTGECTPYANIILTSGVAF